jgi:hypothetical protein
LVGKISTSEFRGKQGDGRDINEAKTLERIATFMELLGIEK